MLKLSEFLGKTAISMLHLNFRSEKIWVKPEGRRQLLPVFHKLRILNLLNIPEECDLTWTMFLLQGAPNLKKLLIVVRDHLCLMVTGEQRKKGAFSEKDKGLELEPSASDFKHHNLAGLSIYGRFQAEDKLVSYARRIMQAAVNLEDIKLYKSPVCQRCKHMRQEWTLKEKSSLSYKIKEGMPSLVRIHFPSLGEVRDHLCLMVTGEHRQKGAFSEEKDKGLEWEPSASDFKHHNLAGLSIYGRFQGEDKLVSYAKSIMQAAVNLEDIKLYKSPVCQRCKHMRGE
ncbi:hypothetical protein ZWY2020_014604 [Hordeum vulgare]|nr:hypothetical protein ZWY2020_014604 [Hordeum vulgare]